MRQGRGAAMLLTFRKVALIAAAVFTVIILFRSTRSSSQAADVPSSKDTDGGKSGGNWHRLGADNNPLAKGMARRKPRKHIPQSQLQNRPLREQLAYQFPYDPESKFPAYI